MAEKRVSVRLAAVGGRQVRAELEGVGEAGSKGFGRLSREMEAANARMAAFSRRVSKPLLANFLRLAENKNDVQMQQALGTCPKRVSPAKDPLTFSNSCRTMSFD